ncbi:amidohydrolase family protein [Prevotella sp. E13-17]|uniref:amidohydrolase family protein n=1 Tax=Prevotella sp. E13-17 TaxID=2913616 RepID=UPI001EDC3A8E|nr:amidohydrolase family protein [Prevotella sp. E13-17]UKK50010.1 amidohydrolase family protein [Prevotella sp. E13-17]
MKGFLFVSMIATATMAQNVVDVHSHIITADFMTALKNEGRQMDEGFPLPDYDVENHLRWMDEAGVGMSVLTLAAPQPQSRALSLNIEGEDCGEKTVIRLCNETAARIKRKHPERFLFCAALPLPDVSKAIEEARYALDVLKADGIKLATNVQGQYLGAPELDTLFAFLNERKAVVILHPHRPEPVNRQVMQQTPLAMQEYLAETTRAVANMISRNVLARYPQVKVVVPHCGAYLPLAIPRMKSLTPVMQAGKMVGEIDYEANLAALYYDLAGAHSPEVIRMMLTITTPDHLLYGSDYPYVAPQVLTQGLVRMRQYLSSESDLAPFREMILCKNAQWLFGQTKEKPSVVSRTADGMLCRLAEIEVHPQYLKDYLAAAAEIQAASLAEEPGVLCLFPTQTKEDSTQIRILEIYASQQAYQHHIQTSHFKKYKQGTLHMVKHLKLQDLQPLMPETFNAIFKR